MTTPNNTIYQARRYIQIWSDVEAWDEWRNIRQEEYDEILQFIETGGKYQLRTLTESSRQGYEISVKHKKVCENKVNRNCPLHNLFCAYPKCEED